MALDRPNEIAAKLLQWYGANGRDLPWRVRPHARQQGGKPDPYHVWLSEVMCQQTRVTTVLPYFADFLRRWPDVQALGAATLEEVNTAWAGLGYYSRARNLHKCAQELARRNHWPEMASEWQQLPGVGPYIAAMIAAILHDEAVPVVDGNVERVVSRLVCLDTPLPKAKGQIRVLVKPLFAQKSGDVAQALMDLGSGVCLPKNPDCGNCPIFNHCCAGQGDAAASYPKRAPKKTRPEKIGNAYVLVWRDQVFLRRRPEKGVLAHMAEVPNSDWTDGHDDDPLAAAPLSGDWQAKGEVRHVFTHFALTLRVFALQLADDPKLDDGWWADLSALDNEPLPSLMCKVIDQALSFSESAGSKKE